MALNSQLKQDSIDDFNLNNARQLLPNVTGELCLSQAMIHVGKELRDSIESQRQDNSKDAQVVLEIFQLGSLVFSSELNETKASDNGPLVFKFDLCSVADGNESAALRLKEDFHIRVSILLSSDAPAQVSPITTPMHTENVRKTPRSPITLASYTAHCSFFSNSRTNRVRVHRSELESPGRIKIAPRNNSQTAMMSNASFSSIAQQVWTIGEDFYIDLFIAGDESTFEDSQSQMSQALTSQPVDSEQLGGQCLSLIKVIINGIPNFDGHGSCDPVLTIIRIRSTYDESNSDGLVISNNIVYNSAKNGVSTDDDDSSDAVYVDDFMIMVRISAQVL